MTNIFSEEEHISIEIVVHILTFFPHFLWIYLCRYFYVRQNGDLRQRETADWMGSSKLQQASIVVLVGRPNIRLSLLVHITSATGAHAIPFLFLY
uniref:Nucellin n=1 Tax=Solanum tuberosum TaxID=4113 RepID=M1B662_SOLTU